MINGEMLERKKRKNPPSQMGKRNIFKSIVFFIAAKDI
jgi:hypothetical protein